MIVTTFSNHHFETLHMGAVHRGTRGDIRVNGVAWPCIINTNRLRPKPGFYTGEFAFWTPRSDASKKIHAIRVVLTEAQFHDLYPPHRRAELVKQFGAVRARGRIYFHPANEPHELDGCIAPGIVESIRGVAHSVRALDQIFEACGGWIEGKTIALEVR